MSTKYYLFVNDEKRGPFERDELIDAGMQRETPVWFKGQVDWLPAEDVSDLADLVSALPPAAPRRARKLATVTDENRPYLNIVDGRAVFGTSATTLATLFGIGSFLYLPGLLFLTGAGILSAYYGIHGVGEPGGFYDPQQKMIRYKFDRDGRDQLAVLGIGAGCLLGSIGMAGGAICYLVILHRAWSLIQDGNATTTPGKAVGLLFVPYFNCYWVFVGIWALARDLNRFTSRYGLAAPRASRGLGAAISFNHAIGAVPLLGLVTLILNFFLFPLFMWSIYRTAAAILRDENRARLAESWHAPSAVEPAVSSWGRFFAIGAMLLAPLGLSIFTLGMFVEMDAWREYEFGKHDAEVSRTGVAHLRELLLLTPQERQRLSLMESSVNGWDRTWGAARLNRLYTWAAVSAGGALVLAAAACLAIFAGYFTWRLPREGSR